MADCEYISVAAVMAAGGFALTARHFFQTPGMPAQKKVPKRLAPAFGPRRLGLLRSGTDPGAAAPVCFAAPTLAVFGCAKRSLRSHARIDPFAQPADGAGTARSRAVRELALIVCRSCRRLRSFAFAFAVLLERACSRKRSLRRPISQQLVSLQHHLLHCPLRLTTQASDNHHARSLSHVR